MPAITGSGEISLSDMRTNRVSAPSAGDDVKLSVESKAFASASVVSPLNLTKRDALQASPHSLSEAYGANFPSSIITDISFTTAGGGSDTNTVDGESLTVTFTTDGTGGTYTVRALDSSNNTDLSTTRSGAGSVTFSSLALTVDTYTPQVEFDTFNVVNDDTSFTHHDAIGAVTITDPADTTVASAAGTNNITHARSIANTNSLNDYNWSFAKSSGDGSNPSPTTSTASTPTVTYTGPGIYTADLRVDGTPSQARNSTTATQVSHRIDYTKAVSIGNPGNVNSGGTINTSVTHQGFSSGVDVDLIRASDNAVLLSNDHTTDSRIVKVTNQNQSFTAPDQPNNTLSVKVKAFDGANVATSNAFSIFPLLTTSKNVINPTSETIYSTQDNTDTGTYPTSFTFGSPTNRTDNVTSRTYTEQADASSAISLTGDTTPSSQTATQPGVQASSNAGNATVRYTVGGNLSQTPTATDCAITVNYMPKIYNVNTVNVAGNGTPFDQITFSYNFQGKDVNSSRLELYDSENTSTVLGTYNGFTSSPNADSTQTRTSSGTVTLTSLSSNFSRTQAGNYVIKIILFGGASQTGTSISAFTAAFDINVVTAHTINTQQLLGVKFGYNSLIGAADTTPQAGNTNTTLTVYAFGNIIDGRTIYTSAAASSVYDGDYHNDNTRHFFSDSSNAFIINDSGVVSSLRSRTANLPTLSGSAVSTATDDITIRVTGNTEVTRTFGVNVSPSIGGSSDANVNVSSQGSSTTTDISLKSAFGASLSSGTTYTVKVKGQNFDNKNSSFTGTQTFSTDSPPASWSSVPTLSSVPFLTEETYISDVFAITLSEGTGNTTVDLDTNIASGDGLTNALIQIAASTSDTSAGSSFTTLQAAESGGGRSQFSIAHTSGVLYFKLKVDDNLGEISPGASDDAFTMTFTNNSVPQTVSGTLREHKITSSDTTSATIFDNDAVDTSATRFSDDFTITVTGCATGDQIAFVCSRTGDSHTDLDNFKLAVNTTSGTSAYSSGGTAQGTGVQETLAVTTSTSRTLTFTNLSAGTNTFRGQMKVSGDGLASAPGPQTGNLIVKATYTNSSGNTIANQTLHTFNVEHNPLV